MGRPAPKQRVSQVFPVGAPIGGIDDTSSIAAMDSMYAIEMVNLFPEFGSLRTRHGYKMHVENLTANGKTLMVFNAQDGTSKLFCATDDGIFDVTTATVTPSNVHVLTEGYCSWIQFSNIAGQWLIGCNGVDAPFIYNGTTWASFTNVAVPASPGEITTGTLTVASAKFVHVHKNRIWFIEKDTLSAWYLDLNAVSGDATEFPLGGIFSKGGYLSSMFSLTMDSGIGADDILVFQSNKGEIGGYAGSNPDTTTDWGLVARFFVGSPLGDRTNVQLSGDVLMLTEFGVISTMGVIQGQYILGAKDSRGNASSRISRTINNTVRERSGDPGWEMISSPAFQYILINLPATTIASGPVAAEQLVMNSITGAWTKYDLPMLTMYEFGQNIYFTDAAGNVWEYGSVEWDAALVDGTDGDQIVSGVQQAYNFFESPTLNKHFKFVKPIFEAAYTPGHAVTISTDYSPVGLLDLAIPSSQLVILSFWDSAVWDGALWAPGSAYRETLVGIYGVGYSASLILKISTAVQTRFVSAHWVFETGTSL